MSRDDIREFTKTETSLELSKEENHQLIPVSQQPVKGLVRPFVHYTLKFPFVEKVSYLTEDVFSLMHINELFFTYGKITHLKCATGYLKRKHLKLSLDFYNFNIFNRH